MKSLFNKIGGSSTCSFMNKETPVQVFSFEVIKNTFFIKNLQTLASGRAQDYTKTVPIAIPNDIFKAYYRKGFIICFLRSPYSGFTKCLVWLFIW